MINEEQGIFTAEEFRAQATELRAAVAELRRRDAQCINPRNPFDNDTEFQEYNQDYGDIVPQIRIPGCSIPVRPNQRERQRIRHYYNIAGTSMLLHLGVTNLLAIIFMLLYSGLQRLLDTQAAGGTLPENYDQLLDVFFQTSSANTAMNLMIYLICNVGIALFGCRWARIQIPSLFQTKGLSIGRVLMYMCIAIGLQTACGYLSVFITDFLSQAGITAYEADFSTGQNFKNVVLMTIYSCIVAPVTEELLFRGFLLKTTSRVSQRFGILLSAVLFGLWHENISQFVLAFFVGIFMGYLTIKHDSIMPAILCHMAVNTASQLFDIAYTYQWMTVYTVLDMLYMATAFIGVILLIRMIIRERLPYSTPHQAERGWRIALTSIPLLLVMALHTASAIMLIAGSSS